MLLVFVFRLLLIWYDFCVFRFSVMKKFVLLVVCWIIFSGVLVCMVMVVVVGLIFLIFVSCFSDSMIVFVMGWVLFVSLVNLFCGIIVMLCVV